MISPFPRAAVWITAMDVMFEILVTAGFLASVGFAHAESIVWQVLPWAILKSIIGVLILRSILTPARRYAALSEAEQKARPDLAASALESVLRAPFRFAIVWASLWVLHFLPVSLGYAARDDVSPNLYGLAIAFEGALLFGAWSFALCFIEWTLTGWAAEVSLRAQVEPRHLGGRSTSLAARLLPLAACLTMAPALWIAGPGFAEYVSSGLTQAERDARVRAAEMALAPDSPPPSGAFVLDEQRRIVSGAGELTPAMSTWLAATIEQPQGSRIDARAGKAIAFRKVGGRTLGAVVVAPGVGLFTTILAVYFLALVIWAAICAATLTHTMGKTLGGLAGVLETVRKGELRHEVAIAAGGEIGRVCLATRETLLGLREIHGKLVEQLGATVAELGRIAQEQTRSVEQQAASLAQAAATTHQIRQTSALAAQKARQVLEVAGDANDLGTEGSASVEASLASLVEIKEQAGAISRRIGSLEEQTLRVSEIVETVKDLADQSNILALNAGLEAAKAGEAARGFAVVATEMRSLADRSLEATTRIRGLVGEVQESIRQSVSITEGGKERMERSMAQIRLSGETLRALADRLREAGQSVRQIGTSVSEQDEGIGQIVAAVQGLDRSMQETVAGIRATEKSAESVRSIAARFAEVSKGMRA
jgi:methyl-accepting chemotaxis protein